MALPVTVISAVSIRIEALTVFGEFFLGDLLSLWLKVSEAGFSDVELVLLKMMTVLISVADSVGSSVESTISVGSEVPVSIVASLSMIVIIVILEFFLIDFLLFLNSFRGDRIFLAQELGIRLFLIKVMNSIASSVTILKVIVILSRVAITASSVASVHTVLLKFLLRDFLVFRSRLRLEFWTFTEEFSVALFDILIKTAWGSDFLRFNVLTKEVSDWLVFIGGQALFDPFSSSSLDDFASSSLSLTGFLEFRSRNFLN